MNPYDTLYVVAIGYFRWSARPPGKTKFDLEYAKKQIQCIRDAYIQQRLAEFVSTAPSEQVWNNFCKGLSLERSNGSPGSLIKFVRVNVGEADEYKDLSKDRTGAYKKALKGHRGQLVYADKKGKLRVRPIYAFESIQKVRTDLINLVGQEAIKGFFQSGCLVQLAKQVPHNTTPLAIGKYKLNTILTDGRAKLTDSSGKAALPISLEKLFAAGFQRAD